MLPKKTLLSASNLNNAFISKTDTSAQSIASNLTISGGVLTLKNSIITDGANASYMRIDPQGNKVIVYDGVNDQSLEVYSSSGSEALQFQAINGTPSYGLIDVSNSMDHLKLMTNTGKKVYFGGEAKFKSVNQDEGIIIRPSGADAQGGGRILFAENKNEAYGFSIGFNGDSDNSILNWKSNSFNLSSHSNNATGNIIVNIPRDSALVNLYGQLYATNKITASGGVGLYSTNALTFDTYGGGFNMSDTTWIRVTGGKSFYQASGTLRTDGILQVGTGNTFDVSSNGDTNVRQNLRVTGITYVSASGIYFPDNAFGGSGDTARIYLSKYQGTEDQELVIDVQNDPSDRVNIKSNGNNGLAVNGNVVWNAGNDGAGSGLDADKLDNIDSSQFLRSDTSDQFTSGLLQIYSQTPVDITSGNQINGLQIFQPSGGSDALMTFHISGDFAVHFGLDGDTNDLSVGGWSMGAGNKYRIWHSGNMGSGSGLDADKLDGLNSSQFLRSDTSSTTTGSITISNGAPQLIFNETDSSNKKYILVGDGSGFSLREDTTGTTPYIFEYNDSTNVFNILGNKAWTAGNDGSGSGLDADLIRSQEPFIDRGYYALAQATSANNITNRGMYRIYWSGMANRPTSYDWGNLVVFDGGSSRQQVFFADTDGTDGGLFFRQDYASDNAWTNWRKVWDDRNMGSGSGLDADKVDGKHATDFVLKAGDTMTGQLVVPSLKLGTTGYIQSSYSNDYIIKDFNNGNVTLSAASGGLYLGYTNTNVVRLHANFTGSDGATLIADTSAKLYYQGTDIDTLYATKSGETYTGTHDFTGATLLWGRDSDSASISLVDYGANTDWLTIDFGDDTNQDRVRFRWKGTTTIFDVMDNKLDSQVPLNLNNHTLDGVTQINGQYGTIAKSTDEWLRINDDGSHASGIYFGGSTVRTDGQLQVGSSGASFKAESNGNVTFSGNMYMSNNKTLSMQNTSGTNYGLLQIDSSNNMFIGSDSLPTILRGNALTVRPATIFNNNLTIGAGSIKSLIWDTGRTNTSSIYWNASSTAQYGMVFKTDGNTVLTLGDANNQTTLTQKLKITSGDDVSLAGNGFIQLGNETGVNMVIDNNEIQGRNNGSVSSLSIQPSGGTVYFGGTTQMNGPMYSTNNTAFVSKLSGYKSWLIHHPNDNRFIFAPSTSVNAEDWNWSKQIQFDGDTGDFTVGGGIFSKNLWVDNGTGGETKAIVKNSSTFNAGLEIRAEGGGLAYIDFARDTSDYNQRLIVDTSNRLKLNSSFIATQDETGYFTPSVSGWHYIAYNGTQFSPPITTGGDRASAKFTVMDSTSGIHEVVTFMASVAFNNSGGSNITVLNHSKYADTDEGIGGIRILTSGTYSTQYLQVYLYSGHSINVVMTDNFWSKGWTMLGTPAQGDVPSGYYTYVCELQGGHLNKPKNVMSGTSAPPSAGSQVGDIYIQY